MAKILLLYLVLLWKWDRSSSLIIRATSGINVTYEGSWGALKAMNGEQNNNLLWEIARPYLVFYFSSPLANGKPWFLLYKQAWTSLRPATIPAGLLCFWREGHKSPYFWVEINHSSQWYPNSGNYGLFTTMISETSYDQFIVSGFGLFWNHSVNQGWWTLTSHKLLDYSSHYPLHLQDHGLNIPSVK